MVRRLRVEAALRKPKSQLCIQVNIVVPGEPEGSIKQAVWQSHHFREVRADPVDSVDHPLGCHNWHIADDLHRNIAHAGITLPLAGVVPYEGAWLHNAALEVAWLLPS